VAGSPSPTGEVEGVTGTPGATPPATDALDSQPQPTGDAWRLLLAGFAGIIMSILLVSEPRTVRAKR
jgi:hypothetical protein